MGIFQCGALLFNLILVVVSAEEANEAQYWQQPAQELQFWNMFNGGVPDLDNSGEIQDWDVNSGETENDSSEEVDLLRYLAWNVPGRTIPGGQNQMVSLWQALYSPQQYVLGWHGVPVQQPTNQTQPQQTQTTNDKQQQQQAPQTTNDKQQQQQAPQTTNDKQQQQQAPQTAQPAPVRPMTPSKRMPPRPPGIF